VIRFIIPARVRRVNQAARGVIAELRNIVTISSLTALERILYAATSALKQRFITYTFLPMNYSRVRPRSALKVSSKYFDSGMNGSTERRTMLAQVLSSTGYLGQPYRTDADDGIASLATYARIHVRWTVDSVTVNRQVS